jgi:dihydroxyacetone kinase-like protein
MPPAPNAGEPAGRYARALTQRASYLGERSVGHQDPGATSAYLLVRDAARTWCDDSEPG